MVAKSASIGMVLALAGTALAQNEIRVRVWCGANYQESHYDAGDPIDIDVTGVGGCPEHINIWDRTGSPTHDIGPVYLYGSRSTDITVTISSGAWRGLDDDPHGTAGGNWDGITASPGVEEHVLLEGHVGGNLTGLISVGEIYRLDIDGQVQSGIQANTSGLGPFWLYAGSVGANGNATSIADSIARVETIVGDLAGRISSAGTIANIIVADDIIASQSGPHIEATDSITSIDVAGDIGTLLSPVEITSDAGNIVNIKADNIHADISATGGGGSLGRLRRVETTVAGGDFTGSITTKEFAGNIGGSGDPGLYVLGDIDGGSVITFNQSLDHPLSVTGALLTGSFIKIRNNLREDGTAPEGSIQLGAGGLDGQIIINAGNAGFTWTGDVTVGSTTLGPVPEYDETASSLGGGAVGLAPFHMHHESCAPLPEQERPGAPASITLQFYGPVKPDDVTKMPVKVYRYTFGEFTNVVEPTDDFDVEYPADPKQVRVVPDVQQFRPKYRYKIVPITSTPGTDETLLLCDELLTASDVPVAADEYWLDVDVAMSMLDMNENEWVDEPDLALWAADPQDFDGSGAADADDLMLITDNLGEPID